MKTQIIAYASGSKYSPHLDCNPSSLSGAPFDRAFTVLIYLASPSEGGQTRFPRTGVSVDPKPGRALIFSSQDDNGFCDGRSLHESLPVEGKGVKIIIQKWYSRSRPRQSLVNRVRDPTRRAQGDVSRVTQCDGSRSCRDYVTHYAAPKRENSELKTQGAQPELPEDEL